MEGCPSCRGHRSEAVVDENETVPFAGIAPGGGPQNGLLFPVCALCFGSGRRGGRWRLSGKHGPFSLLSLRQPPPSPFITAGVDSRLSLRERHAAFAERKATVAASERLPCKTKGSASMWAHDKRMARRTLGLVLGIGVLMASASYGQEPAGVDPNRAVAAAVTGLTDALQDPNPAVRDAAAMALREMGPDAKPAIPVLAQMLRDPDGYLRVTAAHTLDRMGADAVPSLVPLLRDCDPRVRALVAETLRAIGPDAKAAIPALTESLRDESPAVRDAAALALREMGPDAKYAIPALAEMLSDPDGYLRITAAHTLQKLGADAIPALVVMLRAPTRASASSPRTRCGKSGRAWI